MCGDRDVLPARAHPLVTDGAIQRSGDHDDWQPKSNQLPRPSRSSRTQPSYEAAKATIVTEVERLHWRIWNGKAKNAQRSIRRLGQYFSVNADCLIRVSILCAAVPKVWKHRWTRMNTDKTLLNQVSDKTIECAFVVSNTNFPPIASPVVTAPIRATTINAARGILSTAHPS
jgi:hypothetical protein